MRLSAWATLILCAISLPFAASGCGPEGDQRLSESAPVVHQYAITGMHCQDCADAITHSLMRVEGVVDCAVSLKDNSATVAMRDESVEPRVKSGIERLGYKATITPEPPSIPPSIPPSNTK